MAPIKSTSVLKRSPNLFAVDMDGEMVMLDVQSGSYFGLAGVGPHIWQALEHERAAAEIVASVESAFETNAGDPFVHEIMAFLQELVDNGLVSVAS